MSKPVLIAATAVILTAVIGVALFRTLHRPWLVGEWHSVACEEMRTAASEPYFIKREFAFTNASFTRSTHFFKDKNCTDAFATASFSGAYEPLGPEHLSFKTKTMELKAESSEVAQVLSQNKCGDGNWSVNVSQDVSKDGCLDLADKNLMTVSQNFELKQEGDQLFLGDLKNPLARASN